MKERIRELDPLPLSTGPWVCVCVWGGGGGGRGVRMVVRLMGSQKI